MRTEANAEAEALASGPVMCFKHITQTYSNIFTSSTTINYQHLIQMKMHHDSKLPCNPPLQATNFFCIR